MHATTGLLLTCLLALADTAESRMATGSRSQWLAGLKSLLEDCPVKSAKVDRHDLTPSHRFVKSLAECARRRAWLAIDDILEEDVIPVLDGLDLVKFRMPRDEGKPRPRPLPTNASLAMSFRDLLRRVREKGHGEEKESTWREKLTSRLARVLKTHVIKIDIDRLRPAIPDITTAASVRAFNGNVEARGRRRRRRQMTIMPIVMMGVLLMGTVLIPMGFQFLAVLGGKALILAKMALMLSSIQGLKKIATNGVNYGLYHTPIPEAWHERSTGHYEVPYISQQQQPVLHQPQQHHESLVGYLDGLGHFSSRSAVQPT